MHVNAMKARPRRRRLPIDAGERPITELAANLLDRQFNVSVPDRSWAADFTYIWTADALTMALWRRGKPRELLHHSDRDSQYTSEQCQRLIADYGVTCSLSRAGNVWNNAAMESLFSSLKTERTAGKT